MFTIFHYIEAKLDRIAMYRTVTLALLFLVAWSLGLSLFDERYAYSFTEQIMSLSVTVVLALVLNVVIGKLLRVSANHESALITALIIFFLVIPAFDLAGQWQIAAITVAAILSKFILVWRKQHIVNAAAFGAAALSVPGFVESAWWIGSPSLFIPLLIAGSLVVIKIRKWTPVIWFVIAAFVVYLFEAWRLELGVVESIPTFFTSWPALFLAFFMLTEPFTMPATKKLQAWYGGMVGALSSVAFLAPVITMSPELALLIGNVLFWPYSLRQKLYLTLIEKRELAKNTFEFVFKKPAGMNFTAGQYLEWMLPHKKGDNRGQRRYFTIASAPEEEHLRLAVRFAAENGSTYKKELLELEPGDVIIASQRAGDFLLPEDTSVKLAFIAGGIGVTPFSSHLEHMKQSGEQRDVTLYYANNTADEIAYKDTFAAYEAEGFAKVVQVLAKEEREGYEHGFLNEEIVTRQTPDYKERTWYLSGPPGMVNAYTKLLRSMGVPKKQIVQDFFPGLA